MKSIRKLIIASFLFFLYVPRLLAEENDYGIFIVNKSNPRSSLSAEEIEEIFSLSTRNWPFSTKKIHVIIPNFYSFSFKLLSSKIGATPTTLFFTINTKKNLLPENAITFSSSSLETLQMVDDDPLAIGFFLGSELPENGFYKVKQVKLLYK